MRSATLTRSMIGVATLAPAAVMLFGSPIAPAESAQFSPVRAEAASSDGAALVTALNHVLANPALAGSTTGMQVIDASTHQVIYAKNADQRLLPASNEKLLTSVAALSYLGKITGFTPRSLTAVREVARQ